MCGRYAINQTGSDLAATYVVDWIVEETVAGVDLKQTTALAGLRDNQLK